MSTIALKGQIRKIRKFQQKTDGLSSAEQAEIHVELDKLISETDPEWIAKLSNLSIGAKVCFLQVCRGAILGAIADKGVNVPNPQPFRTIFDLINQIEGGNGGESVGGCVVSVPTVSMSGIVGHMREINVAAYGASVPTVSVHEVIEEGG